MSEMNQELEQTKLEKYLRREGRQDFVDEMHRASPSQLDAKLLGLAKHSEEIENAKNADGDLKEAKAKAKVLGATYNDQKRMNKKLARFVGLLMKEKGKL